MEKTMKESRMGKLFSFLIVAVIFGGIASVLALADMDPGGGIMATMFVAFLGAIIAVQVIPGMILFGMMFNGLVSLFRKHEASKTE